MDEHIITSEDKSKNYSTLTWKEIYPAEFPFFSPFQIFFTDGQVFFADKVIRIAPKRRLIAFGTWNGKPVVAKLFFHYKNAKRHMEKDMRGIKALQKTDIPTAKLYFQGMSEDKKIYILLYERIVDAVTLGQIWKDKKSINTEMPFLQKMIAELASQHNRNIKQQDLHLNNYLIKDDIIYTLDGAEIKYFANGLSKEISINNFALFYAQLGVDMEAHQECLFKYYTTARGWSFQREDLEKFSQMVKNCNEQRWHRYNEKIFVECSDFSRIREKGNKGMLDRKYASPELLSLLKNPAAIFTNSAAIILKKNEVAKFTLNNQNYVIQRYPMRNVWQKLRSFLEHSPAAQYWCSAQKINLFAGILAKPIAFVEKRRFGLCSESFYLSEY